MSRGTLPSSKSAPKISQQLSCLFNYIYSIKYIEKAPSAGTKQIYYLISLMFLRLRASAGSKEQKHLKKNKNKYILFNK